MIELPNLRPGSWVGFDTETTGLFPDDGATVCVVSIAWQALDEWGFSKLSPVPGSTIHSAAYPFDMGDRGKPWEKPQMDLFADYEEINLDLSEWHALHMWLLDKRLVGQNIAGFDDLVMQAGVSGLGGEQWRGQHAYPITPLIHWDTMCGNRELFPGEPMGLKPTAARLWGADRRYAEQDLKDWLKKHKREWVKLGYPPDWAGYDLVPWSIMSKYAALDAELALKLMFTQQDMLSSGVGVMDHIREDLETAKLLARMESRGLPYAKAESERTGAEVRRRMAAMDLPFARTDPGARKYFGVTSVAADALSDLVKREGPGSVAETWSRYKKLQTADKMWYSGYADKVGADGRLRTRFRQFGTRTGRLSCERVNLQATPADYRMLRDDLDGLPTPRGLIKAAIPAGYALVQMDLAQAELRTACMVVANRKLARSMAQGKDAHGETATALFHVRKGDPTWAARRQLAKRSNFSLINGVGWATFRDTIHKEEGVWMPEADVKQLVRGWNALYPQHRREIYKAMELAEREHFVRLANGRSRWFTELERGSEYKAHGNSVQGSIGFLTIDWLRGCEWVCKARGIVGDSEGVVLSVHDSVYLLVPADQAESVAAECVKIAHQLWRKYFDPELNGGWSKIWCPAAVDVDIDYAKAS